MLFILILQLPILLTYNLIMKKILVLILVLSLKMASTQAQTPEPTFLGSDKGLRKEEILKLEMKDDLKIYDKRFDSVLVIQKEYQAKINQVHLDKKLTEDSRQKREKDLIEQRRRRLHNAGLDDAAIKRIEDYYTRKEKQPQR